MASPTLLGRISRSAAGGVLLFVGLWITGATVWLYASASLGLSKEADRQVLEVSSALSPLVWNLDDRAISIFLETKLENPEIVYIAVSDPTGKLLWSLPSSPGGRRGSVETLRSSLVIHDGKSIGTVTIGLTLAQRLQQVVESVTTLLASQVLLLLAVLASMALAWKKVALRIGAMVKTMELFTQSGTTLRMQQGDHDELGVLALGFNLMADKIQANTTSMELEIQDRTNRLIESEKLALVGSLVAGVAHEINTPVGNSITITTWLASRTRELVTLRASGVKADEELNVFLADVESSLAILESGLNRTADLIQAFKKIGADQVVDDRRVIDLEAFLNEIASSLQPTLKRFPHQVLVKCSPDLIIDNHSGALFQVVSNLVLNAHRHAFDEDQPGTIVIEGGPHPEFADWFTLAVRDDGRGIPLGIQQQVFQPFFTTKREDGGTGLGLSIVRNLVQNLGGTIDLSSAEGRGSTFRACLPRRAPDRTSAAIDPSSYPDLTTKEPGDGANERFPTGPELPPRS